MARTLAVVNQKGGVGKTTTAVNLAGALAVAERRTLLVDIDPQANATTAVGGATGGEGGPTCYDLMLGDVAVDQALRSTPFGTLDLLPSTPDLVGAEVELVTAERREARLRSALAPVAPRFEYIVIDAPPSLSLLTLNALVAADAVVIPLQCEYFALEGLAHLTKTLDLVRARANPALTIEGIVFTMYDGRTSLAVQVRAEVERYFEGQLFQTVIPRNVRLTEAPSHGCPIVHYDLRSPGAIAYLELAREVIAHDEARARTGTRGAPAIS